MTARSAPTVFLAAAGFLACANIPPTARAAPAAGSAVRLEGPGSGVVDVAVSPDGDTIVTAGATGSLRLWRASDGSPLAVLLSEGGPINDVDFSPDGTRLAAAYTDGAVRVWDPAAKHMTLQFQAHRREARTVAFSPDGRTIATGGPEGVACLWEAESGQLVRRFAPVAQQLPGRPLTAPAPVSMVAFSPDGGVLLSAHDRFDPFVHVWDPQTGRELAQLREDGDCAPSLVFSPDGATLATSGETGRHITLWETVTWRVRRRLPSPNGNQVPLAFTSEGRGLWSGAEGEARQWDLVAGRIVRRFAGEHRGRIGALARFPAGNRVASASEDGIAIVWDGLYADAAGPAAPKAAALGAEFRPEGLWGALAGEDAAAAYDAIWALAATPRDTILYLRNRLPRREPADAENVRRLLAQLDDEHFTVREQATKELAQLGDAVEPLLREQLTASKSPEVGLRIEVLLESLRQSVADADTLRALRATEVFERIGTPEAREALQDLANGASGAKIASRARGALARLNRLQVVGAPSGPSTR